MIFMENITKVTIMSCIIGLSVASTVLGAKKLVNDGCPEEAKFILDRLKDVSNFAKNKTPDDSKVKLLTKGMDLVNRLLIEVAKYKIDESYNRNHNSSVNKMN